MPVDERDIAAVAAHALSDTNPDAAYEVTGPESLTQADRIGIIAAVLDNPIELVVAPVMRTRLPANRPSVMA